MTDLYFHHYPTSPFAEKVRAIFGYKQLAWKSVHQPMVMPKPDLQALTGGYRRIPVLQIGRDIVCDTALICDVLEHLQPSPTLYPSSQGQTSKGAERILAQWADHELFWAAMAYNFSPAGAANVFAGEPPEFGRTFAEDRKAMRAGAPRMPLGDATAMYKSYLRRIASMVDEQPYVLGAAPSVADFACYHPLWFTRRRAQLPAIFEATPSLLRWMDRIEAFGQGRPSVSNATESIAACEESTLAKGLFDYTKEPHQDDHGIALGSVVTITAASFGLEATTGELLAATRTRYSLRRHDARVGELHVHFPRVGFILKKADA